MVIEVNDKRIFVERRLYYGKCERCPRKFVSFYRSRVKKRICGVCRSEMAKISPGQEALFPPFPILPI